MQKGTTRAVINTNRMATVAFIKNPDLRTPWDAMEEGVRDAIGPEATRFLDATRLATALLGDSLSTNIFLLGYAWQMGLVPVSREALMRAVELNGTAVEANRRAFEWGRLACHDPATVEKHAKPADTDAGSDRVMAIDLDAAIARRVEFLTAYQDAALAERYRARVERVRAPRRASPAARVRSRPPPRATTSSCSRSRTSTRSRACTPTASSSARSPPRSTATTSCATTSRRRCGSSRTRMTGKPVKRAYGPWMKHALAILARLKGLRGTWLDPFGHTEERKLERRLITDYERTLDELEARLSRDNLALAADIAAIPATIRGYGHVKRRNLDAAKAHEAELLSQLRAPAVKPMPIAA
jgi:indolepyruvate ferredoxin oxidoreductase